MEYIKKVTSYNSPIEKSSNDRFIEDVDNKLNKYKVADIDLENFSYIVTSTTEAEFTINGKRANYLRIESDIFETKKVSYWFLTSVSEIESDTGTRYNAKLDVMATFGVDVFNQLNGKEVNIKRAHDIRYKHDGTNSIVYNKDYKGLFNNEFNTKGIKGERVKQVNTYFSFDYNNYGNIVEKTYDAGNEIDVSEYEGKGFYNKVLGVTVYQTDQIRNYNKSNDYLLTFTHNNQTENIDTRINDLVATFNAEGGGTFKLTLNRDNGKIESNSSDVPYNSINIFRIKFKAFETHSTSVKQIKYEKNTDSYFEYSEGNIFNSNTPKTQLIELANTSGTNKLIKHSIDNTIVKNGAVYYAYALIQENIIGDNDKYSINRLMGSDVVVAPVELHSNIGTNSWNEFKKIQNNGIVHIYLSPYYINFDEKTYKDGTKPVHEWLEYNSVHIQKFKVEDRTDTKANVVVGVNPHYLTLDGNEENRLLVSSNMNVLTFDDFELIFKSELDANGKIKPEVIDKIDKYDLSLISSMSMELELSGQTVDIDIPNYRFDSSYIISNFFMNEVGISQRWEISDYQRITTNETNYISFSTSQASSYLETHKAQIEAQKKLIDLEKEMQLKSNSTQTAQMFGGGIVGGLLSSLNPATYIGLGLTASARDNIRNIASAKKEQINAEISDLRNTANILNMGKENSLDVIQKRGIMNETSKWYYLFKYAPKMVIDKINVYFKRHGVMFNTYVTFDANIWKGRENYNFLQVKDAEDELEVFNDLDIDVIEDISKELNAGIRIWHGDNMSYSNRNLEKDLLPFVD